MLFVVAFLVFVHALVGSTHSLEDVGFVLAVRDAYGEADVLGGGCFRDEGCDAGFYLLRFFLARDDHELVATDAVYLAVDRRTVTTESLLHYLYSLKNNVSQKQIAPKRELRGKCLRLLLLSDLGRLDLPDLFRILLDGTVR